jgi:N-glycosylase/DNA lyase
MTKTVFVDKPADFSFRHTIYSHGWCDLPPFVIDEENWSLDYVFTCKRTGVSAPARISESDGKIRIHLDGAKIDKAGLIRDVRHILRIDDDLSGFYNLALKDENLAWVSGINAGRLLRSPTVFEDLVKTICTTNCSWALTKKMVTNLVEKLGEPSANGKKAFPTAEAMASVDADFYRDEIRAGYRSPYFVELAEKVASGSLDLESWLTTDLPTPELKKEMKTVKGVGDYAAETMLKMLGRYDGLALDSWLRAQFYKKHKNGKKCKDKTIERHYKKYGEWKGLALWCDMTERWFA